MSRSMKKFAHEIIEEIGERLASQPDSRFPTDDEVRLGALSCYIQELEEELEKHNGI